jgi:membrane protein
LLLGASVTMTSYALSASKGLVGGIPGIGALLDVIQFMIVAAGTAALYHYVPNTGVKWSHAWTGGLFVSAGMEVAKKLLVVYLAKVPTYSVIYGTFATVPILLVWIYLAWVIVLLGALITAYMPSLRSGVVRRDLGAGWRFQLALESLQLLYQARTTVGKGLTAGQLAGRLQVSHLGIESALEALVELDWVARLDDGPQHPEPRFVLLADPDSTPMAPLMQSLMLRRTDSTEKLWLSARWNAVRLREVL